MFQYSICDFYNNNYDNVTDVVKKEVSLIPIGCYRLVITSTNTKSIHKTIYDKTQK